METAITAKRRRWSVLEIAIASAIIGLVLSIAFLALFMRADGRNPVSESLNTASVLIEACAIYRDCSDDKQYPKKLEDTLGRLPNGEGPFYGGRNGKIEDWWGKPYRYALVPNENGELEPYVWTENTEYGKFEMYGAKRTADGQIVRFQLVNK